MSRCIPEQIIYSEILVRLPVKSLLVCKSVCKNWYALISTSDFVNLHLQFTTHTKKPILILETETSSYGTRFYSVGYDSVESSVSKIVCWDNEVDFPFKFISHYAHLLVGSCYGLVCIKVMTSDIYIGEFLCLWNPATREYKKLPRMIKLDEIEIYALGYDHQTDDYKLSAGVTAHESKDTVFQFYSLASNSWKLGPTVPYSISYTARWHEVVVNGHHHWLAIAQRKFFLLSFDIIIEGFKEMQLPKELLGKNLEDDRIIPGVLEGFLWILDSSYTNGVKINVELWEMLDYGVHESWTRRYIITHESIIWRRNLTIVMLWSFGNGKILFLTLDGLFLYDQEYKSARKLSDDDDSFRIITGTYFESLVSLKSGTYVGKKRE